MSAKTILKIVSCWMLVLTSLSCNEQKEKLDSQDPSIPVKDMQDGGSEGRKTIRETAFKKNTSTGIDPNGLKARVISLSDDAFEGRFPASAGEKKATEYIKNEFQKAGLKPGINNSYFQDVPLVKLTVNPGTELRISKGNEELKFSFGDEFIGGTSTPLTKVAIDNSDIVFVGYGIVAPEYGWNDYRGLDVRNKTVLMLVNDPGFDTQDKKVFNGREMTYYGRWTYKFEQAAKKGAKAVILIHETERATYDWNVVKNSWSGPQFSLVSQNGKDKRAIFESWITLESARKVFSLAGRDFDQMIAKSAQKGFRPVPLGTKASVNFTNKVENVVSQNVIGVVPGTVSPAEYIIYTAHWDHLGRDPSLKGDQIYNGALDNATGTAALIELAEAFAHLDRPLARTVVFLATTAEEQGLLGSEYYVAHPVFPLNKTAAVINLDSLNIWGQMRDIRLAGYGLSELDDYLRVAASSQQRIVLPDLMPEKGSFFRSDHFPFARKGIPAMNPQPGVMHVEKGKNWGLEQRIEYIKRHYHKPSDEYDPTWELVGAIEDIELFFEVGVRLGIETRFPQWKENSPYKALREESATGQGSK